MWGTAECALRVLACKVSSRLSRSARRSECSQSCARGWVSSWERGERERGMGHARARNLRGTPCRVAPRRVAPRRARGRRKQHALRDPQAQGAARAAACHDICARAPARPHHTPHSLCHTSRHRPPATCCGAARVPRSRARPPCCPRRLPPRPQDGPSGRRPPPSAAEATPPPTPISSRPPRAPSRWVVTGDSVAKYYQVQEPAGTVVQNLASWCTNKSLFCHVPWLTHQDNAGRR